MLRLLVTPRWIGWTLFALAAVVVCAGMAYWQVLRAESPGGSLLNAGYAFQWPLFGLFFLALWWWMLRAEARALDEVRTAPEAGEHEGHVGRETPRTRQARHGVPDRADGPTPVRAAPADSPFGPRPVGLGAGGRASRAPDAVPAPERERWNAMYAELAAGEERRTAAREHRSEGTDRS